MTNLFVNHTEIIVFGRFLEEKKEDIDEIIKRMEKTISVINSGMGSDAWAGVDANVFKENMENHIRELKIMSGKILLYSGEILKNGKRYNDAFSEYMNRRS